jgi:Spy/CpxP family protein refolding chaperone
MKTNRTFGIVLCCLLCGTWAQAQVSPRDPQMRARLRNNINTLRLLRMTEALNLTEEQTAKLFPAMTRIENEKSELQRQMGDEIQELRSAVQKTSVDDEEILAHVARIQELRRSIRQKDQEFDAVLDANLTPLQKGKYMIFLVDFARGLGEVLNRARPPRGKIGRRP